MPAGGFSWYGGKYTTLFGNEHEKLLVFDTGSLKSKVIDLRIPNKVITYD